MADGKVKVFTTPDCNKCSQARKFLDDQGIDFEYIDVTRSAEALKEMKTISRGAHSVPIISICDQVLVGYDRAKLEEAIACLD